MASDATQPSPAGKRTFTHPRTNRLGGRGTFKAILDRNLRAWQGAIGMSIAPIAPAINASRSRLGISIGRPVGNAVKRNRIKRLIREAFRLTQHTWPGVYDVVLLIKPHDTLTLAGYQQTLTTLITKLHKRAVAAGPPREPSPPTGV